jgi:hypothetical protein
MERSRHLAQVMGPALVALGATEAANLDIFTAQTPPVVYLNGFILFVAGLALVRWHNAWCLGWPVLVTLIGWAALLGGLVRMIWPEAPQLGPAAATYAMLAALTLTFFGYRPVREG